MPLRVALSPDHTQIELTLPGGGKTLLRVEGHTGQVILSQLQLQSRQELRKLQELGLGVPDQRPEVLVLPTISKKIQPRAPFIDLDSLDL
jgi:hypothetical protein